MPNPGPRDHRGVLNLNKAAGITSRDVVDLVSRPLRGVKVGHAGTLDPLATGVLVLCVGQATRLIEYVQKMPKTYRTVIRLGETSGTLDADGRIEVVENPTVPTDAEIHQAITAQVGTIQQIPPQFSALKVEGRRAYDLARQGQTVELASRPVEVYGIEMIAYEWPRLELQIDCGSGTYIRSIARDVGEELGCGGLVEVLTRTRIGPFTLAEAIDPTGLPIETILSHLRPVADALGEMPRLPIKAEQVLAILQGKTLRARDVEGCPAIDIEAALIAPDGELVAIAEVQASEGKSGLIKPRRVFSVLDRK